MPLTNLVLVGIRALVQWLDIFNVETMVRYMTGVIEILKWMIYGDNFSNSQSVWSFTRMKGEVPNIIIQNLKLLATMKRRIHFTVPLVIPPIGALHAILVISKTYNEIMIERWTFQNLKGKCNPDDFIDWLTTIERIFDFKDVLDNHNVEIVAIKLRKHA